MHWRSGLWDIQSNHSWRLAVGFSHNNSETTRCLFLHEQLFLFLLFREFLAWEMAGLCYHPSPTEASHIRNPPDQPPSTPSYTQSLICEASGTFSHSFRKLASWPLIIRRQFYPYRRTRRTHSVGGFSSLWEAASRCSREATGAGATQGAHHLLSRTAPHLLIGFVSSFHSTSSGAIGQEFQAICFFVFGRVMSFRNR